MGQVSSIVEALQDESLTKLDLSQCTDLTDADLTEILNALANNNSVRTLVISSIKDRMSLSTSALTKVIRKHPFLTHLVVRNCHLQPEVIMAISSSRSLETCEFENCRLDGLSLRAISNVLVATAERKHCLLKSISLRRNNGFSDFALKKFVEIMRNTKRRTNVDVTFDEYSLLTSAEMKKEVMDSSCSIDVMKNGSVVFRIQKVVVPALVVKSYPVLEENKADMLLSSSSSEEEEFDMNHGEGYGIALRDEDWSEIKWKEEEHDEFVMVEQDMVN